MCVNCFSCFGEGTAEPWGTSGSHKHFVPEYAAVKKLNRTELQRARVIEDHVERSHLLETIQSKNVAASRALNQNKDLKQQLEEMRDVFDKLELTEQLQKEQHVTKKLGRGRMPNASRARVIQLNERNLERAIAHVLSRRPDLPRQSAQQRHPPLGAHDDDFVIDMPDEDTRLREAGVEAVYCLARGAPKGPNIPRAQLNHQGPLFPGHGYATHSQTWVGEPTWLGVRSDATHQAPTKVGAPCVRVWWPTWLGSVVTLLTKHLAPKVQAPPAGLGDTRLREAGVEAVYCLARGAPKGPNIPRAQLNHQGPLFPGHGYATHSQTWVGEPTWLGVRSDATHQAPTKVGAPCVRVWWPTWLGSVVTLLTKHLAPKVQAPPAGLGVRGDATLQTPAFTGAPCGAV
ncbi:hypothetical protein ISCGN_018775 [Ixodes scapularis]